MRGKVYLDPVKPIVARHQPSVHLASHRNGAELPPHNAGLVYLFQPAQQRLLIQVFGPEAGAGLHMCWPQNHVQWAVVKDVCYGGF